MRMGLGTLLLGSWDRLRQLESTRRQYELLELLEIRQTVNPSVLLKRPSSMYQRAVSRLCQLFQVPSSDRFNSCFLSYISFSFCSSDFL